MKPLEESLLDLLDQGDLLGEWVDRFNTTQPAFVPQLYEFDETKLEGYQRCLLIKNTGNGVGNYLVREPTMSIMIISKEIKGDISVTRDYAELVKDYISTNFSIDCIMSANIIGDIAGPYRLQSSRRYYEINLNVITDTGEV